jgi:predicted metal-dependent HD superfamily phosphohydrolase
MTTLAPSALASLRASCDACFGTPAVWPLIQGAYSEPQRFYHTLAHLHELFAHLAPFRDEALWPAIELAVWGHDVVYATTLPAYADNEAHSAAWLLRTTQVHCTNAWLRAHASHLALAEQWIRATKAHKLPPECASDPARKRAALLFLDADLAILAAPLERLIDYDRGIAQEWAQDPDHPAEVFRAGRLQALKHLREHTPLFHTDEFASLDPLARANLDALIVRYESIHQ